MDQKNFAIGVLSTTAVIMLVGLAVITSPGPALAAGMTESGGDYIMTVGTTPQTDEEYLYVVDVPAQKMIVYRFDANKGVVDIMQVIDLAQFRQPPPVSRLGGGNRKYDWTSS